MNQQQFEQFFQKPEGFIYSEQMGLYFEHTDYRFKYPLGAIGEFNLKWQGWVAAQQVAQAEQGHTYSGTGSDYLDCVLGVGGFESFGSIDDSEEQPKTVYIDYPPDDCSICPQTGGLHMWGFNHCRHCDQPWPEEYRSKK